MSETHPEPLVGSRKAYLMAGVITVIPLLITWWVVRFIVTVLRDFGGPAVSWLHLALRPWAPDLAHLLLHPWFEAVLAVILALAGFYLLGWGATRVVGRRLLAFLDALVHRIPFVNTVYGGVQKFLAVLQQKPDGVDRVVLIDFPSPEMKTVGFVTRTLVDAATGRPLAAVYVPTTPNPTSGYLEIVPLDKVISTDWTMDEAMAFIMSGGAVAPPAMRYYPEKEVPPPERREEAPGAENPPQEGERP
ncbi:MAG: DUF502 domain-containing protein [Syntrophobacterales bacterium]|nr:DUF502 domain-containing protein [Syntrophobacterales bacterium]